MAQSLVLVPQGKPLEKITRYLLYYGIPHNIFTEIESPLIYDFIWSIFMKKNVFWLVTGGYGDFPLVLLDITFQFKFAQI